MGQRIEYFTDLTAGKDLDTAERAKCIYENWKKAAQSRGLKPDATIRDLYARALNTEAVVKYIKDTDRVLDVGCANGFATVKYAEKAEFTIGVDYVAEFITHAHDLHKNLVKANKLDFLEADILNLGWIKDLYSQFDKVICERTLINLSSWDQQKQALDQLGSLVRVGGLLLISEATVQGHESVDKVRLQFGLDILEKHWNNLYIDETVLEKHLSRDFHLVSKESFSLYILLSRVINAALSLPKEPRFNAPINKLAYELSHSFSVKESVGHTVFFVFKKETW